MKLLEQIEEMQNVRLLGPDDRAEFTRLISSHDHYAKEKKAADTNENLLKLFDRSFDSRPLTPKLWGAFNEDNQLDSVLSAWYFSRMPVWCFNWVITDAKFRHKRRDVFKNSGAGLCMDQAISHAESMNRFMFYWAASLRNYSVRQQMFMDSTVEMHRYEICIETVVAPGELPVFEYQQLIIGNKIKTEPWVIKLACLKPKYRFDLLNSRGQLPTDYDTAYKRRDI